MRPSPGSPALTSRPNDLESAQQAPHLHCVAGATDNARVTAIAADATRSYVVTTSRDQSTVWAIGASGDVDASFGAAGKVVVPGNASAAFESGGYLYLQLWDSYSTIGGGAEDGGHFRRIKL